MSALGGFMRQCRQARDMSLQDVAGDAGCSKAHVWDLETGRADNPCVNLLVSLAVALNVSPMLLFSAAVTPEADWQSASQAPGNATNGEAVGRPDQRNPT